MKDIIEGIALFNNGDFFSAHDFFESCWFECEKNDRLFYQGLVQVSVACFHLVSGNYKGSLSQFTKGTDKLNSYLPEYKNLDLALLLLKVDPIIFELSKGICNIDRNKLLSEIPKIEIIK